jgi:hypothetical protein
VIKARRRVAGLMDMRRGSSVLLGSFLAMSAAALGCAPPLQSGGVVVRDGAADRIEMMCVWRRSGADQELCAAPEEDLGEALQGAQSRGEAPPGRRVARRD